MVYAFSLAEACSCTGYNRICICMSALVPQLFPMWHIFHIPRRHIWDSCGSRSGLSVPENSDFWTPSLTHLPVQKNWDPRVSNELGSLWVKVWTMSSGFWFHYVRSTRTLYCSCYVISFHELRITATSLGIMYICLSSCSPRNVSYLFCRSDSP